MKLPEIPGYRIEALIGKGSNGYVYAAEHESGAEVVIKFLDPEVCNPGLIENRLHRLYRTGTPVGVVPLRAHSLEHHPYLLVSNRYADRVEAEVGVEFRPRSLQILLGSYLGQRSSWVLIRQLAQALAAVHERRVAHGNLKPGNVFLNDEGFPLLSDFAQGLMPGIQAMDYTDALLYAPPEQLRDPEGYFEGAGYQWDVYAFSVLAYRLINGVFPRCHEAFNKVAPEPGMSRMIGVEADCLRIAENLEVAEVAPWIGIAPTPEEAGAREVINKGLNLDPNERFADMVEVWRALEEIVSGRDKREAQFEREENFRMVRKRARTWQIVGVSGIAAAVVAMGLLGVGAWNQSGLQGYRWAMLSPGEEARKKQFLEAERAKLKASLEEAARARDEHLKAAQTNDSLRGRYALLAEDLAAALQINDLLLAWVVEKGADDLPAVEDRVGRLRILEESLTRMLQGSESHPLIGRQRWRIELALGELALASGDPAKAKEFLTHALAEAPAFDSSAINRLARARVLICMLGTDPGKNPTVTTEELTEARDVVKKLEPTSIERHRLQAALQIAQARVMQAAQQHEKALELYRSSFEMMRNLCERQPTLVQLRLWRARGYSEAATAAEGFGVLDASTLLRHQAAVELVELLDQEPESEEIKLELAMAYAAMAEGDLLAGRMEQAEELARKGQDLLKDLPQQGKDAVEVLVHRAVNLSVIAYCEGEVGNLSKASSLIDEGLSYLRQALENDESSALARYRFGVLTWQKASQFGLQGDRAREIKEGLGAREVISALLEEDCEAPSSRQLHRSLAYLNGDLGHAALMAGRQGEAVDYFRNSLNQWTVLSEREAGNPEFLEGQEWARDRLRELDSVTAVRTPRSTQ